MQRARRDASIVNAMTHRRRGLLPRQRLRRHRAAHRVGADGEPRRAPTPTRLLEIFDESGVGARSSSSAGSPSGIPQLVRAIAARGHEIASHGYAHRLVYDQTPRAFREDVRRAKALLEDGCGRAGRRLPRAELLDHAAVAVGARRPDRGRLPLRRQHLSDSPRSLRHPDLAAASLRAAARRRPSSKCRARPSAGGR